ncbi:hypothetical protein KI743_01450 [Vibrio sp. D420a]|uniref:hypothetical protein n=1 Tax=Vibrio sp. D420a TaxID=2836895 RepID=UPI002554B0C8|nr:hypothetical protein [Vibrio sp. D420a]MDK9760655.1 hypothetical protein [Vibrio sp. D420a]
MAALGNPIGRGNKLDSRAKGSAFTRRTTAPLKRKRIFVLGDSSNDLALFAAQQLDIKCYGHFDIICYSIPTSAVGDRANVQTFGRVDKLDGDFTAGHYDLLITVSLNAIQMVSPMPTYDKLLFWDVEKTENEYDAVIENVNFFMSRYMYG